MLVPKVIYPQKYRGNSIENYAELRWFSAWARRGRLVYMFKRPKETWRWTKQGVRALKDQLKEQAGDVDSDDSDNDAPHFDVIQAWAQQQAVEVELEKEFWN